MPRGGDHGILNSEYFYYSSNNVINIFGCHHLVESQNNFREGSPILIGNKNRTSSIILLQYYCKLFHAAMRCFISCPKHCKLWLWSFSGISSGPIWYLYQLWLTTYQYIDQLHHTNIYTSYEIHHSNIYISYTIPIFIPVTTH